MVGEMVLILTSSPAFIFSSISCSCLRAFKNADFKRAVCSAFKSFFTFCNEHRSHKTTLLLAVFLFFQQGEKSTLHCEQTRGLYGTNSSKAFFSVGLESRSRILSTTSSNPTSIMKSILFTLGMAFQSAGGGRGGGICNRVCSSWRRSAALAAFCFCSGVCLGGWGLGGGCGGWYELCELLGVPPLTYW